MLQRSTRADGGRVQQCSRRGHTGAAGAAYLSPAEAVTACWLSKQAGATSPPFCEVGHCDEHWPGWVDHLPNNGSALQTPSAGVVITDRVVMDLYLSCTMGDVVGAEL